ncbi:MAG: hypothetical protein ACOZCO_00295 [Bacteroidota bacterium]
MKSPLTLYLLLLPLLLLISADCNSQTYTSGSKNIGFGLGYGYSFLNSHPGAWTGQNPGHTFSFRATRKTLSVFYPSVNYYFNKRNYLLMSGDTLSKEFKLDHHSASPSIGLQIPAFSFFIGKSSKYECTYFQTFVNAGAEYMFHFGYKGDSTAVLKNNFAYQFGLGFIVSKSGGSKSVQGRDVFINLFNKRMAGEKFILSPGNQKIYDSFWGVELLVILNKTYKFSNM